MITRIIIAAISLIAVSAIGTFNKIQRTLLSPPNQQIQQRIADTGVNCGSSCTRSKIQQKDKENSHLG